MFKAFVLLFLSVCASAQADFASARLDAARLQQYADLAQRLEVEYLQIDTTNPPGNEMRAVEFFKRVLDAEGIENRTFVYDPAHNRGNLWAILRGTGAKRPLILLNHMDVVSGDPRRWKHPPFSAALDSGYLYGRGAQDMKSEGLAQLVAMIMLKRERVALDRDVIFLATADEEADGTGTDWFIKNQRPLLANAEYLITEGGYNEIDNGKVKFVGVDVAEKTTYWLRVTAKGTPGHGSHPLPDSAPNRLVAALSKILAYQTPVKLTPTVEEYLRLMAEFESPQRAEIFRNIRKYLNDPKFIAALPKDDLNPQLRNTIQLTMLGGSQQTNVIPGEAWAQLDIRMLPGEDPQLLRSELLRVVNDPNVTIEPVNDDFRIANSSPTSTELFAAIKSISKVYFGNAPAVPRLTSGYTENQRYRELGIVSYGFSPYAVLKSVSDTEHGDDERIELEQVRRGFRVLYDLVTEVTARR